MPWTCEYCGLENYNDDRIALKEPACPRCGHRRGERAATIKELQAKISRLREEDRAYSARIRHYKSVIDDLWAELHGFEGKHDSAVKEQSENYLDLQEAEGRLRVLLAIDPAARQIAEDQRTLTEVQV